MLVLNVNDFYTKTLRERKEGPAKYKNNFKNFFFCYFWVYIIHFPQINICIHKKIYFLSLLLKIYVHR